LVGLVEEAIRRSKREFKIKHTMIRVKGEILTS